MCYFFRKTIIILFENMKKILYLVINAEVVVQVIREVVLYTYCGMKKKEDFDLRNIALIYLY